MRKFYAFSVLPLVLASFLLIGCSQPQPPAPAPQAPTQQPSTTQTPTTPSTQQPAATQVSGKDLYDQNCAGCHGTGGAGGSAPRLNTAEWTDTQKAIGIIKAGRGGMPGFDGKLKDNEIQAIADYIAKLPK